MARRRISSRSVRRSRVGGYSRRISRVRRSTSRRSPSRRVGNQTVRIVIEQPSATPRLPVGMVEAPAPKTAKF